MRPIVPLAVLVAALCALSPASAVADEWAPPSLFPAPAAEAPSVLAATADGRATVVWGTDRIYGDPEPLTVESLGPLGIVRRWSSPRATILGSAQSARGEIDLLTEQGTSNPVEKPGRLVLYRIDPTGAVTRVWSAPFGGGPAAVARHADRVAVSWIDYGTRRPDGSHHVTLRLVSGRGDHRFGRPHAVRGVLPSWLEQDLTFVSGFGLALDPRDRAVFALTAWHRPKPQLVLATTTLGGAPGARQVHAGVDGLVTVRSIPSGRIGVLVHDTGIEGETGECIGDGQPRRIWTAVRAAHATRFGTITLLDSLPLVCGAADPSLLAGPGGAFTAVWGTATDPAPPTPVTTTVRLARAPWGESFAPAATVASDLSVAGATITQTGSVVLAGHVTAGQTNLYAGPFAVRRLGADGAVSAPAILATQAPESVLATTTPSGRPLLAWTSLGAGDLALSLGDA